MSDITILGFQGPAGTGKDLVSDWFVQRGFIKIALADALKRFIRKAFGFTTDQLWGESEFRNKEIAIDDNWWFSVLNRMHDASDEIINYVLKDEDKVSGYLRFYDWIMNLRNNHRTSISPRVILQTIGTSWGRLVDPLMWVRYTYETIDAMKNGWKYSQTGGLAGRDTKSLQGIVIPDHRFFNEVEYTNSIESAFSIKLKRLARVDVASVSTHISEEESKSIPDDMFDCVLELDEGVELVHKQLEVFYEKKQWMNPDRL